MTQLELETAIEALIDSNTLSRVLDAVSSVCHDKSVHIEDNWQDMPLAKQWLSAANAINRVANRAP